MRSPLVIGVAWAASAVIAFLLGARFGDGGGGENRSDGARRPAAEAPAAPAAEAPPAATPVPDGGEAAEAPSAAPPAPAVEPFTTEGAASVSELSERLMKFVEAKLREGPEGHKELLRLLDRLVRDTSLRPFLRDEHALVHELYPWLRFAFEHEREILALAETFYKTAAEEPGFFQGMDDDPLEMFTEGIALLLPGAADDDRMERFRGYVETVLATPEAQLPEALQKNLRRFRQNLEMWSPPLTAEEILAQLMDPAVPAGTKMGLLMKADPRALKGVDVAGILAPALERGDNQALFVALRLELPASDVVRLDRAVIEGLAGGKMQGWSIARYLERTGRTTWEQVRPFYATALARGENAPGGVAEALAYGRGPPAPVEFVSSLVTGYELDENIARRLKDRYGLE